MSCVARPALYGLLSLRLRQGKELAERLPERRGIASQGRPAGFVLWVHAASVGEAQSALILIDRFLAHYPDAHVLITTGTVTSARFLEKKPMPRALHQFSPLDTPLFVKRFFGHWRPDAAIWMESELWPNMLMEIQTRKIPSFLVNARLSQKSFDAWRKIPSSAKTLLSGFTHIFAQTEESRALYEALGAQSISVSDNIKYSAAPLPADAQDLAALRGAVQNRPCWLFASTHEGEEDIACRVHKRLKEHFPHILTIIVPRHPVRGAAIYNLCGLHHLDAAKRSEGRLPDRGIDIYIADTIGELGLFYRLSPIAVIGRTISLDGGGGHNPIEAAQLGAAILFGPHMQFQQQICDDMLADKAALQFRSETDLAERLTDLLRDQAALRAAKDRARAFALQKNKIIDAVWDDIAALLQTGRGQT